MTTAQRRQQERYEQSFEARQQKAAEVTAAKNKEAAEDQAKAEKKVREDMLLDKDAYPGRVADLKANAAKLYGKEFAKNPAYVAKLLEEEDIDKNRLEQETVWAREAKSADEYANLLKGPPGTPVEKQRQVTPEALKRRKAFWDRVRGVVTTDDLRTSFDIKPKSPKKE